MKKRLFTKALILVMIMSLAVPMPVFAAKKSKGGKLPKNITYYRYNHGRWEKSSKTSYTYDKKNYPAEISDTSYGSYFMGIPFSASTREFKAKYKYKGKTPKSMTLKNASGKVEEKRKYDKKGNLTSRSWTENSSSRIGVEVDGTEVGAYENITLSSSSNKIKYNKKGLATSVSWSNAESFTHGTDYKENTSDNSSGSYSILLTQKKGVPSYVEDTNVTRSSSETWWSYANNAFKTITRYNYADGTWSWTGSDGTSSSGKSDILWRGYSKYNKNGFLIEAGEIRIDTATGARVVFPRYRVTYKMKKGLVTQATLYEVDTDANSGIFIRQNPQGQFRFKYDKKLKVSKERYFNMVNSQIGHHGYIFNWY
ncbi:MAG: hypothetical protein IKE52_05450 [Mogibacterium sp.]|nr:hypothetical protein [Mogibacterium sp.]